MRRIVALQARDDWTVAATFSSDETRLFDVKPLLGCEAFPVLRDLAEFKRIRNGGYYVEWDCGADLSADTLYVDGRQRRRRIARARAPVFRASRPLIHRPRAARTPRASAFPDRNRSRAA